MESCPLVLQHYYISGLSVPYGTDIIWTVTNGTIISGGIEVVHNGSISLRDGIDIDVKWDDIYANGSLTFTYQREGSASVDGSIDKVRIISIAGQSVSNFTVVGHTVKGNDPDWEVVVPADGRGTLTIKIPQVLYKDDTPVTEYSWRVGNDTPIPPCGLSVDVDYYQSDSEISVCVTPISKCNSEVHGGALVNGKEKCIKIKKNVILHDVPVIKDTTISKHSDGYLHKYTNPIIEVEGVVINSGAVVDINGYNKVHISSMHAKAGSRVHIYNGWPTTSVNIAQIRCSSTTTSRSLMESDDFEISEEYFFVDAEAATVEEDQARLYQNTPNPFTGETVIGYYIPDTAHSAYLRFMTAAGVVAKAISLSTFGEGEVSISANELSAGVYFYTLVVDGQIVNSRQMVVGN